MIQFLRFVTTACFCLVTFGAFAQVDYSSEIQPIFNDNCVSCHGGQSGVTLTSYSNVMNSVGDQYGINIVIPDSADASPIIDKISSANPEFGVRMPQGGPYLSTSEIELIRDWINEGATETPTSNELISDLPDGYKLRGNYPNPFNPSTVISFEVPRAVKYNVSLYTAHGILVEEIAGIGSAGVISVPVTLNESSSGVYFYRVTAASGTDKYLVGSGRMTLLK